MEPSNSPAYTDEPRPYPVSFGGGPDDYLPHSWAEKMLTQLAQENPRQFGKLLQAAALNEQS
jgi:hypothetical protein